MNSYAARAAESGEVAMRRRYAWIGLVCLLALGLVLGGCAKREHRKVRLHEEQHEGEVVEESPGEMIVE